MPAKLTLEYVEKFFEDRGCKLLATEYKNNHTKMPYICTCGRRAEISFSNFQQGIRCADCGRSKQLTLEYVKAFFDDHGCKLLATEYKNSRTKMTYICSCGRQADINFNTFQQGGRCNRCRGVRIRKQKQHSYEYVKAFFDDHGCKLLATEYKNNHTKMPYICGCNRRAEITFANFMSGKRCIGCGGTKKLTLEFVRQVFKDNCCALLATTYINNETRMPYVCVCGQMADITYGEFRSGRRCLGCSATRASELLRHSFEYVKMVFAKHGCTLLACEYRNAITKMPYICVCGRQAEITFDSFQHGSRCYECGRDNIWQTRRVNEQAWEEADIDLEFLINALEERRAELEA